MRTGFCGSPDTRARMWPVAEAAIDRGSGGGDGPSRRRLGRQPERAEQAPPGLRLGHRVQNPARPGTAGTDEDLDREHATEERGPGQPTRRPRGLGASRLGVARGRRHDRRTGQSAHCQPARGGNTPASTAARTSAASLMSWGLVARSSWSIKRWSSGDFVLVSTPKRSRQAVHGCGVAVGRAECARDLQTRVRPGGCLEVRDDEAALGVPLDQIHRADQPPDYRAMTPATPPSVGIRGRGTECVSGPHRGGLCCIPSHNPAFRGTLGHS